MRICSKISQQINQCDLPRPALAPAGKDPPISNTQMTFDCHILACVAHVLRLFTIGLTGAPAHRDDDSVLVFIKRWFCVRRAACLSSFHRGRWMRMWIHPFPQRLITWRISWHQNALLKHSLPFSGVLASHSLIVQPVSVLGSSPVAAGSQLRDSTICWLAGARKCTNLETVDAQREG